MAQKVRHLSNCSISESADTSAVVIQASSEVSNRNKEDARKVLYLSRI
jgi:hypothetical protein